MPRTETDAQPSFTVGSSTASNGVIAIRVVGTDPGARDYRLLSDNLRVMSPTRTTVRGVGATMVMEWRASRLDVNAPWTVVAIEDGRTTQRREIFVR